MNIDKFLFPLIVRRRIFPDSNQILSHKILMSCNNQLQPAAAEVAVVVVVVAAKVVVVGDTV